MSARLAAIVLSHDEEQHIGPCLDSVEWADYRLVFDDYSSNGTADVARRRGVPVVLRRLDNFCAHRNAALDALAAADDAEWVLFVDADERITPALATEIREAIERPDRVGWWIPRHNYLIGHRMRGGGWFPDAQLRLFRRDRARYDAAHPVHEVVILDGEAGTLENAMIHYNYDSVAQFRRKQRQYLAYEARMLLERGVRARPWTYVTMPVREFWRRFVRLQGYRDHFYGVLFCGLMAYYTFAAYWRLHQMRQNRGA